MKRLSTVLLLLAPLTIWAACPEGQKLNDRTYDCEPIPGWKKPDPNKIKLDSYDIESTLPSTASDWSNNPLKVGATWSFPSEGKQPYPLVIYLLSSGGYSSWYDGKWIKWFNNHGFAILWVDQYTARGMNLDGGLGTKQSGVSDASYISDVYAAIRTAKADPRIDPERIVTFGMSWGGGVQMYLMSQWWEKQLGGDDVTIAGHIALGPACYLTVEKPVPTTGKMLMLLGEKDIWNQPTPCRNYAERLRQAGASIMVETVEGANHAWDFNKAAKSYRAVVYHCDIRFDPKTMDARNVEEGIRVNFSKDGWGNLWDKCTKKAKVTTGGTKKQLNWTRERVRKHLVDTFGM
jgi:dienelactone hydrolase